MVTSPVHSRRSGTTDKEFRAMLPALVQCLEGAKATPGEEEPGVRVGLSHMLWSLLGTVSASIPLKTRCVREHYPD